MTGASNILDKVAGVMFRYCYRQLWFPTCSEHAARSFCFNETVLCLTTMAKSKKKKTKQANDLRYEDQPKANPLSQKTDFIAGMI